MSFENAYFEFAVGTPDGLPKQDLPEIVFSGRSNVGKSSMINKLLNRKALARVSSQPGKTATINFYNVGFCRFADLPGYGYARVSHSEKLRWAELVEGYFASARDVRLVVQIIDMRRLPTDNDRKMIEFLLERRSPFVVVATKSDKLNHTEREEQEKLLGEFCGEKQVGWIPFSTVNGEGVKKLRKQIENVCRIR